jgi:CHAT domain-containing protein/tetratricopeptide (TPR) repeat protein
MCLHRRLVSSASALLLFCLWGIAQTSDTVGLSDLAQSLSTAYAQKNAALAVSLWSERSPDFSGLRDRFQKLFASPAPIHEELDGLPAVSGDRARLRFTRATGANKEALIVECVREQSGWKIWKETPTAQDLADRLVAAASLAEQESLISANTDIAGSGLAFAVLDHAHQSRAHSDYKQALAAAELALRIAVRTNANSAQARALTDIGLVHYDQGDIQEAMDWFQQSLTVSESNHDDRAAGLARNSIGNVYKDEGEFSLALDCYRKTLAIGEKLHDEPTIFRAAGNLGIIHLEIGDEIQALSFLNRARDIAEHSSDKRSMALVLINIGQVFERQGDYVQAGAYAQRALDLSEAAGDRLRAAVALLNLGSASEGRGDLANALLYFERSRAISDAVGDRAHAALDLTHMGTIHMLRKEYAEATELYRKSLEIEEAIGAKLGFVETLIDLASVRNRQGQFEEALQLTTRALAQAGDGAWIAPVWRAHLQAGNAYRGLKQLARAETEYNLAISVIEDLRTRVVGGEPEQAAFFENRLEVYSRMIELLAAAGRNTDAWEYAERAKARVLVDVLKAGRSQIENVLTAAERRRDQELRAKMASANARVAPAKAASQSPLLAELQNVRVEYTAFQAGLYAAHPEIKVRRGEMDPIHAEDAQRLAGPSTGLIEFSVSGDKLFVFALGDKVQVFVQPVEEKKLSGLVEDFRRQLANRDLEFRTTAKQLYQLVLGPAGSYLKGKEKLVIVPDGPLWELPFQALVDPAGRYLLDNYAISYAPSLTALKFMVDAKRQYRRTPEQTSLLAMGNPAQAAGEVEPVKAVYGDVNLGSLPLAETEVQRIGRVYGAGHSRVFIGADARESRFKAEAAEAMVLHLATHGILNDANPLYSYLLLARDGDGGADDGLLEAWELLQMKLHAELAVLSACETARGRLGAGEGMIGFSWALFVAGVPTTVLSQWKVESDSTSQLMLAFHRNRLKNMNDAEALRAAAMTIRKNPAFQHPFYWAPFVVIGAGLER